MSLQNSVANEVDELRGRLSALMVNYPDTEIRLRPLIEVLDVALNVPTPAIINEVVEELIELRSYMRDIAEKFPEIQKSFDPSIYLIDRLLGPTEGAVH